MTDRTIEAFEALLDKKDEEIARLEQKINDLKNEFHLAAVIVQTHSDDNEELAVLKHHLFNLSY